MAFTPALIVAIIGAAIATVGVGVGTWQQVEARDRAADEADALAEQKDKEAQAALEASAFAERQHRRRIALLAGKQAAITAASGVAVTSGSALAAESDLTIQGELEALQIRRTGKIESQSREFEARLARYRADTQRGLVKWDITEGVLSAASSGVDTYSAYKGYNYRSTHKTFTSNR